MGRVLERRGVLAAVFVLHVAVTLWTTLHHEPWRDEANPWLLMRDGDARSILAAASGRGAPLLFELTVWPFARLGAPYLVQQLLNLVYTWLAVGLVLRSRAFAAPVKILFAFSYYPAFEYNPIARPYGLQMLLTFAVAEAWRTRREQPLRIAVFVALLANTTVMGLLTAAVAGAILLWERIGVRAVAVMLGGGLAAVVQLWPREDRVMAPSLVQLDTLWFTVASAFFPDLRVEDAFWPAIVVLGVLIYAISRHWQPVAFLAVAATGLLAIYFYIWMGGLRHAGLLLVVALASVWIADAYGPFRRERLLMAALAVSLAYSIIPATRAWAAETRYAFSGSREAASFLKTLDEDIILVSHGPFWNSAVLVYLPGTAMWYPASGTYGTYSGSARPARERGPISLEVALSRAERQLAGRKWVVVVNGRIPGDRYRLLFETKRPLWRNKDEIYRVYAPAGYP